MSIIAQYLIFPRISGDRITILTADDRIGSGIQGDRIFITAGKIVAGEVT